MWFVQHFFLAKLYFFRAPRIAEIHQSIQFLWEAKLFVEGGCNRQHSELVLAQPGVNGIGQRFVVGM
jgi:hypothetical protein